MRLSESFAVGLSKYAYSAEWFRDRKRIIRQFSKGNIDRSELIRRASTLHTRPPFEEPENFQQAYYNVHFWSNRAKLTRDKSLYRKKDTAIIDALKQLDFKGIKPITPTGYPNLLEIQVPSHGILLHTYNPVIKRMLIDQGLKIGGGRSPSEAYLRAGRKEYESRISKRFRERTKKAQRQEVLVLG